MSLARNVGKIVGKGMKVSYQSVDNAIDKAYTKVGQTVYAYGAGMKAKNAVKIKEKAKPFVDKIDDGNVVKRWDNLYTGKKLNPLYTTIGVGAVTAVTAAQIEAGKTMAPITSSIRNVEHGGPPEIMLYDGVGQQSAPSNLNANGNLVFGLHNQRKG